MPKLSKREIDSISPDPCREVFAWDDDLKGFGVRVMPSGRKSFVIQYRSAGRTRRMSLGAVGVLTPAQARSEAIQRLAEVAQGGDPSRDRRVARLEPTMSELAERYLEEHAKPHKKPSSYENDVRGLRLHVLPALGSARVKDVTRQEVAELHSRMRATPIIANRTLALISKMFSLARLWGIRDDNPVVGVPRFRENRRERYLSEAEIADLGRTLREAEAQSVEPASAIAAIRLLLFTGCRKGEILSLRWPDVDFERGLLWLRDSKTGARTVPINAPAREILVNLQRSRTGETWVIEGRHAGKPLVGLWRVWSRVRDRAGLVDLRLHDLRHTHASVAADAGLSLPVIGALLGHASPATTSRYAHLADDPRRRGSDIVGAKVAAAMFDGPRAELLDLPIDPRSLKGATNG